MKVLGRLLSIVAGLTLLAGCANVSTYVQKESTKQSPTINEENIQNSEEKEQFVQYITQHLNVYTTARDQAVLPYIQASERNNGEEMKSAFQDQVLPFYEKSLKELQDIQPQTAETKELHQLLIQKEMLYYESFQLNTKMVEAYNKELEEEISKKMGQMQQVRSQFETRLTELKSKYSLEEIK